MVIIANIFLFIGAILLCISTFSKKKHDMLLLQTGDCVFNALASLLAINPSGFTTNIISSIRNVLNAKNKMNKGLLVGFVIAIISIGLMVNKNGWIGLLPPIASIEYTIWTSVTKSAQKIRYGLLINLILWLIHDLYMHLYPMSIAYIIIIAVTIYNIGKNKSNID